MDRHALQKKKKKKPVTLTSTRKIIYLLVSVFRYRVGKHLSDGVFFILLFAYSKVFENAEPGKNWKFTSRGKENRESLEI